MAGYNIQCDQGSLYYRKCYVVLASGEKQEIIGYTSGGDPISKDSTDVPRGTAWVPTMTTLDMSGNAYQPYPEGIPYTAGGGAVVNWTPSGGADVANIDTYLNQSIPGAYARQMEKDRTCNPLWPTFGCKTYTEDDVPIGTTGGSTTTETSEEEKPSLWDSLSSWWSGSAENFNSLWVGDSHKITVDGGKQKFRKGKNDNSKQSKTQQPPTPVGGNRRWIKHEGNWVATTLPPGVTPENYASHYADSVGTCEWQGPFSPQSGSYSGWTDYSRETTVAPYAVISKNWLGRYKRQHYNDNPKSSAIPGSAVGRHPLGPEQGWDSSNNADPYAMGGQYKSVTAEDMVIEIESLGDQKSTIRHKVPLSCAKQLPGWQSSNDGAQQMLPWHKPGHTVYILANQPWLDTTGDLKVNGMTYAEYNRSTQKPEKKGKQEQGRGPEGADFGQPLDAGGDALGSNFGQDQGAQARMAADDDDDDMEVIEQQISGNYIEPTSNVDWNKLALPAVALGGLGLALYAEKRMNRGVHNEQY